MTSFHKILIPCSLLLAGAVLPDSASAGELYKNVGGNNIQLRTSGGYYGRSIQRRTNRTRLSSQAIKESNPLKGSSRTITLEKNEYEKVPLKAIEAEDAYEAKLEKWETKTEAREAKLRTAERNKQLKKEAARAKAEKRKLGRSGASLRKGSPDKMNRTGDTVASDKTQTQPRLSFWQRIKQAIFGKSSQ